MPGAVVVLAVVVGVLGAELGLRKLAGIVADRRLTDAVGADVRVSVRGVFAGLRLLTGRAHEVHALATDVPVRGGEARIRELTVHLEDVDLDLRDSTLRAVRGGFTARLGGEDVNALAGVPSVVGMVEVGDDVLTLVTRAGIRVAAAIDAEDGDLVVRPVHPIAELTRFRLRLGLGDLPGGATVRRVEVRGSDVVVRGELDGARLTS